MKLRCEDNFVLDIYYNIKRFFRKIISTIKWLPIIWKDYQFDEYFLFKLLQHKFEKMENHFRFNGMHVGSEREADKMKVCKLLCERLCENDYTTPWDKINAVHLEWFSKKIFGEKEYDEKTGCCIISLDGKDEPDKRYILLGAKHEDALIQQDIDLLCKIIQKHAVKWWD